MSAHTTAESAKQNSVAAPIQQQSLKTGMQTATLTDNRPEAIAQRQLKDGINKSESVQQLKAYQAMANNHALQVMQKRSYTDNGKTVQRALIVGSYNEKYDIEDMGLWWTMACEHKNAQKEGLNAVILTLKDFDRDVDQEYTISIRDKIRFISHGNKGGKTMANETLKGHGEGDWANYGMDLKNDNWLDIERRILEQIQVFNIEAKEQIETGSLLKPYFCYMKENEELMNRYQPELLSDNIGVGPVFLTNKYVLAIDEEKLEPTSEVISKKIQENEELNQLFNENILWRKFGELQDSLPLLKQYKTEKATSTVNLAAMYDQIYAFIEPKYQALVDICNDVVADNVSNKGPWENLREKISDAMPSEAAVI
jgi:hypothetical protein